MEALLGDEGATSGQVVLKLGHSLDTGHPVHRALELFRDRLQELSEGTMTVDIYPGGVLGSELQCLEQLQNGSLAMTKVSAAVMENFVPEMSLFGQPYLFRDSEHFWEVLEGPVGRSLLGKGEDKGVRGLCFYDAGSRNFYTRSRPIRVPEDLAGMKIRVMNSATAIDMVKAMGGAPTPIAWGELYSALAQGTVDGAENNPPSFVSNKHYEVCRHFTLDGHTRIPDVLLIGTGVWQNLPARMQRWVGRAARESSVWQRQLWSEETVRALDKMSAEGVAVYDVDRTVFAARVATMAERIENGEVAALVDQIRAME
jgi:tripartite ATP-independent transporter DctP family solute receptor